MGDADVVLDLPDASEARQIEMEDMSRYTTDGTSMVNTPADHERMRYDQVQEERSKATVDPDAQRGGRGLSVSQLRAETSLSINPMPSELAQMTTLKTKSSARIVNRPSTKTQVSDDLQ